MGTDRCRRDDWHYVDSSAASGKEIFTAMLSGRLWLNLLRVDLVDRRYGDVIRQLISDLQQQCKRLGLLSINFGTLLNLVAECDGVLPLRRESPGSVAPPRIETHLAVSGVRRPDPPAGPSDSCGPPPSLSARLQPGGALRVSGLFQQPGRGMCQERIVTGAVGREAREAETHIHR
jgi:hypothetical protein